jgi:hypothetical protein
MSVEIWKENRAQEYEPEEAVAALKEELKRFGVEEPLPEEQIRAYVQERLRDGIFHQQHSSRMGQVLVKL